MRRSDDSGGASSFDMQFKVVIIGDSGVGKSCLLMRYAKDLFEMDWSSTVGVDFFNHQISLEGRNIQLQMWDTAGQERFRNVMSSYYRGAQGIAVVYDVTKLSSFEHVPQWLDDVVRHASSGVCLILVGNKSDMSEAREVAFDRAKEFAEGQGLELFETSAKENHNVADAFEALAKKIMGTNGAALPARSTGGIAVGAAGAEGGGGSRCCGGRGRADDSDIPVAGSMYTVRGSV